MESRKCKLFEYTLHKVGNSQQPLVAAYKQHMRVVSTSACSQINYVILLHSPQFLRSWGLTGCFVMLVILRKILSYNVKFFHIFSKKGAVYTSAQFSSSQNMVVTISA